MQRESVIRLPIGVRDFLPRAAARRRAIVERLLAVFASWGYARILAPAFEYADVLERGLGGDARQAAIRFVEPLTGEVVALRPDITPQVARMAATRLREVGGPLRLCYEGSVTRLAAGPRGQREILQAGVELIGVPAPAGDAEVLAVAAAAMSSLKVDDVRLDVGHVALARAALEPVTDPERRAELCDLLGKKDRAGVAAVAAAAGVPAPHRALLGELPRLYGAPAAVLERARALRLPAAARRAVDAIDHVLAQVEDAAGRAVAARITVDLGEVSGFEYYTGLRFAGYAAGVGDAVLRGGRYDELLGRYGFPACATGFAVDIEAIAQTERAAGIEPAGLDAVLIVAGRPERSLAARLAGALRGHGQRVAVDGGPRRPVGELCDYARAVGFARVVVVGSAGARILATDTDGGRRLGEVSTAILTHAARGRADKLTKLCAALHMRSRSA
jgi:ATP phosphoribosyltransferase regulatory subunit